MRTRIHVSSDSIVRRKEQILEKLKDYPFTARELAEELNISLDYTRTVLSRLEQEERVFVQERRYQLLEETT